MTYLALSAGAISAGLASVDLDFAAASLPCEVFAWVDFVASCAAALVGAAGVASLLTVSAKAPVEARIRLDNKTSFFIITPLNA